jgi:alkylated DNA repair protein (DNA oxidative demethylase)
MEREPPSGFLYYPDVLSTAEEADLARQVREIAFSAVEMRGQVARRRTAHFGWVYGYESWRITPGPPLPDFLLPLRERVALLAAVAAATLAEVLVTEYPAGATIGWHRDAPQFGVVIGVSLLSPCRMRFQRGRGGARETRAVTLEPRSAYVLTGEARQHWQHSIPTLRAPRYSVTFRTLRTGERGDRDGETALRRA